jgi:hypothetical protein
MPTRTDGSVYEVDSDVPEGEIDSPLNYCHILFFRQDRVIYPQVSPTRATVNRFATRKLRTEDET